MRELIVHSKTVASLELATLMCTAVATAADPGSTHVQIAKQFQFSKTVTAQLNYLLFLPKGYEANGKKHWPLLLFLHGAGERGTNVWKVATHGPPKLVAERSDFPFIVVSPQCPEEQIWSNEALLGLLDDVISNYAVDRSRIYLTGLSMGGYGTWSLGLAHPQRFAAIVPICGGGEMITVLLSSRERTQAFKTLGIWAFHGGKDPVVPLEESKRMIEAVKKAGVADAKLTVYPEAGHDSWTETYNNPELYDWLLKHRREAP